MHIQERVVKYIFLFCSARENCYRICNKGVPVPKEYNLHCHYETLHKRSLVILKIN